MGGLVKQITSALRRPCSDSEDVLINVDGPGERIVQQMPVVFAVRSIIGSSRHVVERNAEAFGVGVQQDTVIE